jgi:hypothetical protein
VIEDDSVIMDFSRSKMAVESHRDWVCSKVQYYYRMILSKLLRRVQLTAAVHCFLSDLGDFVVSFSIVWDAKLFLKETKHMFYL